MLGLSVGAAYVAPQMFHVPPEMAREAFWCILIVGCSSAIQFALNPYGSIFVATQRFDLASAIGVTTRLLTAAGIAFSLRFGYGLIGVSLATCSVSALDYVIRWRVARRLSPAIEVGFRYMSFARVREIAAFGAWNSLISINQFIYQHVPNILIGLVLPIAAVGHYALATGLLRQLNSILGPLPAVLYPAATELHVRGERARLERLYHDGSRMTMLVMIPLVLAAGLWAPDFYRLWIGDRYLGHGQFQSVAVLFQILLISSATGYAFSIAQQILIGAGRVRTVAVTLLSASALNLALSLILIRFYGLAGVALATVTASVAIDLLAIPLLLQHAIGLSFMKSIRNACGRPLAACLLQVALMAAIRWSGQADTWPRLVTQGALAALGSGIVLLFVGVTAAERQRLVFEPLKRWWRLAFGPRSVGPVVAGTDR
jgi:O-antigen/teichoic acid export membrane protein